MAVGVGGTRRGRPVTGSYSLEQTDISLQHQTIQINVARACHSAFTDAIAAKTGWFFSPFGKRLVVFEDRRELLLHDGASLVTFRASATPGEFGAMASRLYQRMKKCKGIKEGKVAAEDLRRITLWLDCNCNFFGAYHNEEAQARGEVVRPELE